MPLYPSLFLAVLCNNYINILVTLLTKSTAYLDILLRYMFGILASFDNIYYLIVLRSLPEYGLLPTINSYAMTPTAYISAQNEWFCLSKTSGDIYPGVPLV